MSKLTEHADELLCFTGRSDPGPEDEALRAGAAALRVVVAERALASHLDALKMQCHNCGGWLSADGYCFKDRCGPWECCDKLHAAVDAARAAPELSE